jgi:RimJ/RimL family protein N-acetyltransferase
MNDLKVTDFTEQKYKKHSLKDIRKFVNEKNKSKNEFLYGIFVKKIISIHIGNIKLGPINWRHKSADISYFLGEKDCWGKGYITKAIKEIIKIAKKKKIKKLKAGTNEKNIGSIKVLIKNGFKLEGKLKSEILYKGRRYEAHLFGKIL